MKLSSFRLRIALFSALLAGVAVSVFGGVSYVLLYQSKANNLDLEIKERLLREASIPKPNAAWDSLEESRNLFFTEDFTSNSLVLVRDRNQSIIYQSSQWDDHLNRAVIFPPQPAIPSDFQPRSRPLNSSLDSNPNRNLPRRPPNSQQIRELAILSPLITTKTSDGYWRLGTVSSPFVQMAIAVDLEVIDREMALIRNIFFLLIPATLFIVMAGAWWLSNNALTSIRNITNLLRKVTVKGLDKRASITNLDAEFIELVSVFNQMMARLERSFQQASRFSGDAAHELKTPLAILQGELESAMQTAPVGSPQQQTFGRLLDEVRRLSAITRKLLLLSLADAGQMNIQQQSLDFSELIEELAEDIDLMAPELELKVQISPDLKLKGDRHLLTQVLQNLITNAVKYNVPSGWIALDAFQKNNTLCLKISNPTKGISKGDRQKIFERFHRGDSCRNRQVEGFGLGLSLSREITRAHGGDLKLESTPAEMVTFILSLPVAVMG